MIPDLVNLGNPSPWPVLPAGVHDAEFAEIDAVFAYNPRRQRLFGGFLRAARALAAAQCSTVYLDGSFTTGKLGPNDFDGCWDPTGVDPKLLDPVLLEFKNNRAAQKAKYYGELFLATASTSGTLFLDFFQTDKHSGKAKGILTISLAPLSQKRAAP